MIYLAPGNSVQIKAVPKPRGVVTVIQQASWDTSDPAVATVAINGGDGTGCTATVTVPRNARVDSGADIMWRYKNTNGQQAASALFTVRVVPVQPAMELVTGADILSQPVNTIALVDDAAQSSRMNEPGQPAKGLRVGSDVERGASNVNDPNYRGTGDTRGTNSAPAGQSRVEGAGAK